MSWLLPIGIASLAALVVALYAALKAGADADDHLERWAQEHPERTDQK